MKHISDDDIMRLAEITEEESVYSDADLQLMEHLGIKLVVSDGSVVVDIRFLGDENADVAATASRIAERCLVVGGGYERGIARTVGLNTTKDWAPVHLHLRQHLLQLGLLP